MLRSEWLKRSISLLLCLTLSLPAIAAEPLVASLGQSPQVLDLALRENGTLAGKLVNREGQMLANVPIELTCKRGARMTIQTDASGVFVARDLKAGEVTVRVANQVFVIRAWHAELAPPATPTAALFVVGDAVRGQCCPTDNLPRVCNQNPCSVNCGGCNSCGSGRFGGILGGGRSGNGLLSSPIALASIVGAAIAIPLAIDDDDAS